MNSAPPPVQSPKTKDEVPDTPTGKFRALEADLKHGFRIEKIYTGAVALLALMVSLGAVFGGYRVFLSDARAQTKEQVDAGLKDHALEIAAVKEEQTVAKEERKVVLSTLRELQLDVRESYKAARYDRYSPRLEAPPKLVDAGVP